MTVALSGTFLVFGYQACVAERDNVLFSRGDTFFST